MPVIGVHGAGGRMGREVIVRAIEDAEVEIRAAFESADSPMIGLPLRGFFGPDAPDLCFAVADPGSLAGVAVAIDFSTPAGTLSLLPLAARAGTALVIGTTGFDAAGKGAIRDAAGRIPILLEPNLSEGAQTLFALLPALVERAGADWDMEIVECHHRGKADAPSGTALRIAEILAAAGKASLDDVAVYGRHGHAVRRAGEIGIHSLRSGDTPGEHTVRLGRGEEELIVTHRIHGRAAFARGALRAAKRLAGRKPGLYTVSDLAGGEGSRDDRMPPRGGEDEKR